MVHPLDPQDLLARLSEQLPQAARVRAGVGVADFGPDGRTLRGLLEEARLPGGAWTS